MARKKAETKRPIESYEHRDKQRVNNPPVGLVTPETDPDAGAKKRYAYDPHLDPQLQWAGKAEHTSFEVPTVSLHVHERIDPRTIIEAVRTTPSPIPSPRGRGWREAPGEGRGEGYQLPLFEVERQEPLRSAIEFYQHKHGWTNRLIAGDSLLVMNSLLEKEGLAGKVQMIYIDPPYGIKYGSNFQPFVNKRDVKDGKDEDLTAEPEQIRAFRDTWELGIHSYLTYLRDRLLLARELLTESGSVFVQISDENVHHVRELMDEVFGAGNFVGVISFKVTGGTRKECGLPQTTDFLLWYAKDKSKTKFRRLYREQEVDTSIFSQIQLQDGTRRFLSEEEKQKPQIISGRGRVFSSLPMHSKGAGNDSKRSFNGRLWSIPTGMHWRHSDEGFARLVAADRVIESKSVLRSIAYFDDFPYTELTSHWHDTGPEINKDYVVQTAELPIQRCLLMTTDPGDLVFDPTCGSGTTAYVAEQWGRRWITCDTSRVALTLARQRLMTAVFDYYELAYPSPQPSPGGRGGEGNPLPKGDGGEENPLPAGEGGRRPGEGELGVWNGFKYKTVPHVTLKSIANNPEIDGIHARWQTRLEPIQEQLNALLFSSPQHSPPSPLPSPKGRGGKDNPLPVGEGGRRPGEGFEDWQIPREPGADWPEEAKRLLAEWWDLRRKRQAEIDAAIARHAPQETLYDQPLIDRKKVRVTGPFTVEAVPAPVVKSVDELLPSPPTPLPVGEGRERGEGKKPLPDVMDPKNWTHS